MLKHWLNAGLTIFSFVALGACSSGGGGGSGNPCGSFCGAFAQGDRCEGVLEGCNQECPTARDSCAHRADPMLQCLTGLAFSCTAPGVATASGDGDGFDTLTISVGTLEVDDARCAELVAAFKRCDPAGASGGSGGSGASGGSGGSGGSCNGGLGVDCNACINGAMQPNGCCGAESAACRADTACNGLLSCMLACAPGDDTCYSGCMSQNPNGAQNIGPLFQCSSDACIDCSD